MKKKKSHFDYFYFSKNFISFFRSWYVLSFFMITKNFTWKFHALNTLLKWMKVTQLQLILIILPGKTHLFILSWFYSTKRFKKIQPNLSFLSKFKPHKKSKVGSAMLQFQFIKHRIGFVCLTLIASTTTAAKGSNPLFYTQQLLYLYPKQREI